MNKKLLIAGAITTALVLTACVKKEEPKQEQEQPVETTEQQPTQLDPVEPTEAEIPPAPPVAVEHQVSNNTTATITREYRDTPATEEATPKPEPKSEPKPAVQSEAKPAVEKPTPSPKSSSSTSQSEDDAVAAAIAAATPALEN